MSRDGLFRGLRGGGPGLCAWVPASLGIFFSLFSSAATRPGTLTFWRLRSAGSDLGVETPRPRVRPRDPGHPLQGQRRGALPSALKLCGSLERTLVGWSAVPFSSHSHPVVLRPSSMLVRPQKNGGGEGISLGYIHQDTGLPTPRPKVGSYCV